MKIIQIIKMNFYSLLRSKLRYFIYILVISLGATLLFLAYGFNVNTNRVIDDNLNSLDSEVVYRKFHLKDRSYNEKLTSKDYIERIKKHPYIDSVEIVSSKKDGELLMDIIVDDYRNVEKVIENLSQTDDYIIIRDENSIVNVETIDTIKFIGKVSLITIIILNFIIISITIKTSIDDRTTEIALLKAIGYNNKHLFLIIFTGSILSTFIGYVSSIFITIFSLYKIINPVIVRGIDNSLIGGSITVGLYENIFVVLMLFIISLTSSIVLLKKTKKISPCQLLKN